MRKLLLLLLLVPAAGWCQTTRRAVKMTVTRTQGTALAVVLPTQDDEAQGPVYDITAQKLHIKGMSVALKRIKEIRFEGVTEEVDAIQQIQNEELKMKNAPVYDLMGRRLGAWETLGRGIYIIGGKKYRK